MGATDGRITMSDEMWFRQADGTILARSTGSAWVYAGGTSATDDVVSASAGLQFRF
jgi:hypothetical protein